MKQKIILSICILMYSLTTTILVAIPLKIENLDTGQISFLIFTGIAGYLAATIYLIVYLDNRKKTKNELF